MLPFLDQSPPLRYSLDCLNQRGNIPPHPKTSVRDSSPGSAFRSLHPELGGLIPAVSTGTMIHPFAFRPLAPLSPERGGKLFRRAPGGPARPGLQSTETAPPPIRLHGWLMLEEDEHTLLQSSLMRRFRSSSLTERIRSWPTGTRSQDAGLIKIEPRGGGGAARTLPRLLAPHNRLLVQQT